MSSTERLLPRANRQAQRLLLAVGQELREARLVAGLSQAHVAGAIGLSRPRYTKAEAGQVPTLQIREAALAGAVVGLDLSVRLYPGGQAIRDVAQLRRLDALLAHVRPPLTSRREAPLPPRNGPPEQRAWDAVILGRDLRTCVEVETRLRDIQAVERRLGLKRRDDPPDRFLLVIAATATNRRVLAEHAGAFADLPRLRLSAVTRDLQAGRHPPHGVVLL